eukprot:sb/3467909/
MIFLPQGPDEALAGPQDTSCPCVVLILSPPQSKSSAGRPPRYLLPVWQSMLCMVLVFLQMMILMFIIIFYPLKQKTDYSISGSVLVVCSGATEPVGYVMCFMVLSTVLSYQSKLFHTRITSTLQCFVKLYSISGIWQKFCIGIATQIIAFSFLMLVFSKKVEIVVLYPERNKIVFEKDKINKLDMTRKERRKSFLVAQHCHMCGQALKPKPSAGAGLMAAASLVTGLQVPGMNHRHPTLDVSTAVPTITTTVEMVEDHSMMDDDHSTAAGPNTHLLVPL